MTRENPLLKVNRTVFFGSAGIILLFVLLGALFTEGTARAFTAVQDFIVTRFGWFYIVAVAGFLVFVLALLISPYANIKLGKDADQPEYSRPTWFAMLFSAGMGIGLVFYGVAEPVLHFADPPRAVGGTAEAGKEALLVTFFHWGLHPWAIYAVVGMSLAYVSYRHDLPLTIRWTLFPLLGDRVRGKLGDLVEIMAVVGTLFGVATSLGLGVMQINSGLDFVGFLDTGLNQQLWLIAGITALATVSVVSGLDKGVRRLSELNLIIAVSLLFFVFFGGPTTFLLNSFVQSVGYYAQNLVELSFRTDAYRDATWMKSWTMFYWGWWISWSPFVGMFIARISRGRTIREFILGVLFVPALVAFFWMVVFGNTAIHMELFGQGGIAAAVKESVPTALFVMLQRLPFPQIASLLGVTLVGIFFVTSSDSASLVIDILTSNGNPEPPTWQRIFWAVTEGVVAAILLLTGGLAALQTAALTTALPFCVIILLMCVSLLRGLRVELRAQRARAARAQLSAAGKVP